MRKSSIFFEVLWFVIAAAVTAMLTWWLNHYFSTITITKEYGFSNIYPSIYFVSFAIFIQSVFFIWLIRTIIKRFSVMFINVTFVISNIALIFIIGPFYISLSLIHELAKLQTEHDVPVRGSFYGGGNIGSLWINNGFNPITLVLILTLALTCFMTGLKYRTLKVSY